MNKDINPTKCWSDVTGAFCRHWSDPWDCENVCITCGHLCKDHDFESGECGECDCSGWKEGAKPI